MGWDLILYSFYNGLKFSFLETKTCAAQEQTLDSIFQRHTRLVGIHLGGRWGDFIWLTQALVSSLCDFPLAGRMGRWWIGAVYKTNENIPMFWCQQSSYKTHPSACERIIEENGRGYKTLLKQARKDFQKQPHFRRISNKNFFLLLEPVI